MCCGVADNNNNNNNGVCGCAGMGGWVAFVWVGRGGKKACRKTGRRKNKWKRSNKGQTKKIHESSGEKKLLTAFKKNKKV